MTSLAATFDDRRPPRALRPAGAVLAALGLAACTTPPSGPEPVAMPNTLSCTFGTCVPMVFPPAVVEAGGLRRVALVPDRSPVSAAVVNQLESQLSKVRVNDAPYYTIVPPGDPTRQATFELVAGVSPVALARTTEERTKCADNSSLKDLFKCKSPVKTQVACTVRKVTIESTTRIRRSTGDLLATRQHAGAADAKFCQGDATGQDSDDAVRGAALADLVRRIQESLTVTARMVPVRYKDAPATVADPARQQRFREAVGWIKAGRLDRGCPIFEELTEIETQSAALFYNAGFCSQTAGDWRRAYRLYQQADRLLTAPDKEIKAALDETALAATQGRL